MLPQLSNSRFSAARKFTFLLLLLVSAFASQAQQPVTWPAGKSGFTAKLMNIEAATSETFRYSTTLHNGSASAKIYELKTDLPFGWMIAYKVDGSQVTSINMDAGKRRILPLRLMLRPLPLRKNIKFQSRLYPAPIRYR